jgi:hypothetical protein
VINLSETEECGAYADILEDNTRHLKVLCESYMFSHIPIKKIWHIAVETTVCVLHFVDWSGNNTDTVACQIEVDLHMNGIYAHVMKINPF